MITVDYKLCDECGTCISICPNDAIILGDNLQLTSEKCTSCGLCISVCPFGALSTPCSKDKKR
ncbi:MAG: DUF362 domain-containing protein [Chitinispirillaceae bacterium]